MTFFGWHLVPHNSGHVTSTTCDTRSDRAWSEIQHFGDFVVVQAHHVSENYGGPKFFRYLRKGIFEGDPVDNLLIEVGAAGDSFGFVDNGEGPTLTSAQLIERGVGCHSIAPRLETGPTIEPLEPANNCQERLLAGVGCVGIVSRHAST
jgi:hypothetical protein